MKYIGNGLFAIGLIIAFVGIGLADVDLLLAIKAVPCGLIAALCGWLLDDMYVEVEDDDFSEYL